MLSINCCAIGRLLHDRPTDVLLGNLSEVQCDRAIAQHNCSIMQIGQTQMCTTYLLKTRKHSQKGATSMTIMSHAARYSMFLLCETNGNYYGAIYCGEQFPYVIAIAAVDILL